MEELEKKEVLIEKTEEKDVKKESPKMTFTCASCCISFSSETTLNAHKMFYCPQASPEVNYRCAICGYKGNTLRGMRLHSKTHAEREKSPRDASPDVVNTKASPGDKYCSKCDISFTYQATFDAHKKFYCSSHHTQQAVTAQS